MRINVSPCINNDTEVCVYSLSPLRLDVQQGVSIVKELLFVTFSEKKEPVFLLFQQFGVTLQRIHINQTF